jgi:hypothetical protein
VFSNYIKLLTFSFGNIHPVGKKEISKSFAKKKPVEMGFSMAKVELQK